MSRLTSSILAASILAASLGFAALPAGGAADAGAVVKDQSRLPAGLEETWPAERIEAAFALAGAVAGDAVDAAAVHRVAAAARKADRLAAATDCGGQAWPYIAPGCLAGTADRAPVRTVTVEYRAGDSASVLVRLPATQLAGR